MLTAAGLIFGRLFGLLARLPLWVWPLAAVFAWGAVGRIELHHLRAKVAGEHAAQARAIEKSKAEAAEQSARWAASVGAQQDAYTMEIGRVAGARDAALAGLRERGPRRADVPGTATSACAGATGRELSGPDAAVAIGLAADADRLRAALGQCQRWIETVTAPR